MRLPVATAHPNELLRYALTLLEDMYEPGYAYKKAGVMVSGIVPRDQVQQHAFDRTNCARHERLTYAMRCHQQEDGAGHSALCRTGVPQAAYALAAPKGAPFLLLHDPVGSDLDR